MKLEYKLLAVVLAVVMGVLTPLQALAVTNAEEHLESTSAETLENELKDKTIGNYVGNTILYVCDVKIATGKTADECKKALHNAGYIVYDNDLNEGTDPPKRNKSVYAGFLSLGDYKVEKRYTYLGYRLTTDPSKAITNLHVMDEDGGYDTFSYKEFATSRMPGLEDMIHGMMASCNDMRAAYNKGSYAAKVAKEYLDLFCVPKTSAENTGVKLGTYLLDPIRTENEFRDLLLVLDTLMLNVINAYLAIGISDTKVIEPQAPGGLSEDGTVAATYTSHNGIIGYTSLIKHNLWLQKAAIAMTNNSEFANVNKTDDSEYFFEKITVYGAQVAALRRAFADNTLSPAVINYLKSEKLEGADSGIPGKIITEALGAKDGCTVYDLLTKGSDRLICLFLDGLPEVCDNRQFIDVLEVCATDCQNRIPDDFKYDKRLDIDWVPAVISSIDNETISPTDKSVINSYATDIENFVGLFKPFMEEYEKKIAEYDANPGKSLLDEDVNTVKKAEQSLEEALANPKEADPASYLYYVGIRNYFSKFTVLSGNGQERIPLMEYLIKAVKGKNASDATVKARIYPVVKALSAAKKYSYKSNSMFSFFIDSMLGTDELADLEMRIPEYRAELEEAFGSENFSIWKNSNRYLIEHGEDGGISITSQRVMDQINEDNYDEVFPKEIAVSEKYKTVLVKLGVAALSAVAAGLIALALFKLAAFIAGKMVATAVGIVSSLFLSGWALTAFIFSALGFIAVAALVVIAIVAIVYAILYLVAILTPEAPPSTFSKIPEIMLDCVEDGYGVVTGLCRYDVVTDVNGVPADINVSMCRKWNALYYTKDPSAGSPLTAIKNTDGTIGDFFTATSANTVGPDNSVPLSKFLSDLNYNLNNHCFYDRCSGKYLHFYTEDSLKGIVKKETTAKKYIDSIIIGHSTSDEGTQAYVLRQSGYQLLGTNLSPNAKFNTYIAFHTTNTESSAITDIRAAYSTTATDVMYGDTKYHAILDESMLKIPAITCEDATERRQKTAFSYGLYTCKSTSVGDPLLASGIGYASDLEDIPENAEVICYFGGMPLDFNSFDGQEFDWDDNHVPTFDVHRYVYFTCERDPEIDYTSKEYLAGLAFFSGSDDKYSKWELNEYTVDRYALGSFGANVAFSGNLTPGLYNNEADVTRLGFISTHNPKRALTDMGVFTGEPKNGMLPQNLMLADVGYCVCDVYTQGDYWFYGKGGGKSKRVMRTSHAYFTSITTEYWDYYWPKSVAVLPRGLYVAGPHEGAGPIELCNVVYSMVSSAPPSSTKIHGNCDLHPLTTTGEAPSLDNTLLDTTWHSVHAIDQYYYDKYDANGDLLSSFNIGLGMSPEADALLELDKKELEKEREEKQKNSQDTSPSIQAIVGTIPSEQGGGHYYGTGSLYIYYRNGAGPRVRGNYVANVALSGSITINGAYDEARCNALAGGEDIVNLNDPICLSDHIYTDMASSRALVYGTTIDTLKNYNNNCYLVSATYTNDPALAVGAVRMLTQKTAKETLPESTKMPLYDPTIRSSVFKKRAVAPISSYLNIGTYTTHDGTPINRVEVRFANTTAGAQSASAPDGSENGAAEYYVQKDDTMDPFIFKNKQTGMGGCICIQRSLDADGSNHDEYIMSLKVIESTSYDGNMTLPTVWLGAMGYPYAIDFDVAESKASYGSNAVVAIAAERTSDPRLALKDIRLSSDDLGKTYVYNNMRYDRVNDKPILLEGADKNGVYIYTTDGSDSRMFLWSEVDKENTDWTTFDWEHLDYKKSNAQDLHYYDEVSAILNQYPEIRAYVNMIRSDDYTAAEDAERLRWAKRTAITNIGYEPSEACPEQYARNTAGITTKNIYWAGCSAYGIDCLPVSVTESTPVYTVSTFGDAGGATGLRITNAGNLEFRLYESPADRFVADQSASVFTNRNTVAVFVLSLIFLAGLAVLCFIYRKKFTGKKEK